MTCLKSLSCNVGAVFHHFYAMLDNVELMEFLNVFRLLVLSEDRNMQVWAYV
jgi:hypothetical protein